MGIGHDIAEARRSAGLTQDEVAGRVGVSRSSVTRLESDGAVSVSLRTAERICRACGVELAVRHDDPTVMSYLQPIRNPRYLTNKVGRTPERVRGKLARRRLAMYEGRSF